MVSIVTMGKFFPQAGYGVKSDGTTPNTIIQKEYIERPKLTVALKSIDTNKQDLNVKICNIEEI